MKMQTELNKVTNNHLPLQHTAATRIVHIHNIPNKLAAMKSYHTTGLAVCIKKDVEYIRAKNQYIFENDTSLV